MTKKRGLTPMWTDSEVERFLDYFVDRAGEKMFLLLQRAGEEFVKLARESGQYKDHTGNLRSSIGYVIVANGKIIARNFEKSDKGTDRTTGKNEARNLTNELSRLYRKGLVLIGVAGMDYAVHVEAIKNKDVISSAATHTEDWIKKQSKTLFDKLSKKGY